MRKNDRQPPEEGASRIAGANEDEGQRVDGEGDGEGAEVDGDDDGDGDGDAATRRPQITLDRYLSRRRAPSSNWAHLLSMLMMLITLVLIIVYKDRCGAVVSGLMGDFAPTRTRQQPPVKYQLNRGENE